MEVDASKEERLLNYVGELPRRSELSYSELDLQDLFASAAAISFVSRSIA